MTAIAITGKGGPEVLEPLQLPVPPPGPVRCWSKSAAAGVNRPDVLQRKGLYPAPKGHSELPGLEVAGRSPRLAPAPPASRPASKVMALVNGGGYARILPRR